MIGMWSLTHTQPDRISTGCAKRPEDVPGPHRCREPVGRVVGQPQSFVVVIERQDDKDRSENFVLHDLGVLRCVNDKRRLVVGAFRQIASRNLAAAHNLRAIAPCPLDEPSDPLLLLARDQRTLVSVAGSAVGPNVTPAMTSATPWTKPSYNGRCT